MMKQSLFLFFLLLACWSCSKDDEQGPSGIDAASGNTVQGVVVTNSAIAGEWIVTENKVGSQWAQVNNGQKLVLTEDGIFQGFGVWINCKYVIQDKSVNCYDYENKLYLVCDVMEIKENALMATITQANGTETVARLSRTAPNSANWRDPISYLKGEWRIDNSDNGGTVRFQDNGVAIITDGDYRFVSMAERHPKAIDIIEIGGIYSFRTGMIDMSVHPLQITISGKRGTEAGGKEFHCTKKE
jgi:hypothetical protein